MAAAEDVARCRHALTTQANAASRHAIDKTLQAQRTRWWQPKQRDRLHAEAARERAAAERADATHPQDRQRTQRADQNELTLLRGRITSDTTAATDADTHHDRLLAEQHLRAGMPDAQRTLEQRLRLQASAQRITRGRQAEPSRQLDSALYRPSQPTIDRGGPSLGL